MCYSISEHDYSNDFLLSLLQINDPDPGLWIVSIDMVLSLTLCPNTFTGVVFFFNPTFIKVLIRPDLFLEISHDWLDAATCCT